MSKAILVINMPDKCSACPCFEFGMDNYCYITGETNYSYYNKKPDDCPLKPVPEKKLIWSDDESCDWERGFNDCIDEILGN